jgi:hypothetical protein
VIDLFRNLFNLAILDAVFVIPGKDPGSRVSAPSGRVMTSSQRVLNEQVIGKIKRFKVVADKYRNRRRCFGLRLNLIAGIYNTEHSGLEKLIV